MKFKKGVKRAEQSNYIDVFVNGGVGDEMNVEQFNSAFDEVPALLTEVSLWRDIQKGEMMTNQFSI